MTESPSDNDPVAPTPFHVSYSGLVRDHVKDLVLRAKPQHRQAVLHAFKEIDRILHLYPQFGQPLRDLKAETGQIWMGVVAPLVVRYVLFEERRLVVIVEPIKALPNSDFFNP